MKTTNSGCLESQNNAIKKHLEKGLSLTSFEALRYFGCLRLSGRIYDLKNDHGVPIRSEMVTVAGKRIARYSIEKQPVI